MDRPGRIALPNDEDDLERQAIIANSSSAAPEDNSNGYVDDFEISDNEDAIEIDTGTEAPAGASTTADNSVFKVKDVSSDESKDSSENYKNK